MRHRIPDSPPARLKIQCLFRLYRFPLGLAVQQAHSGATVPCRLSWHIHGDPAVSALCRTALPQFADRISSVQPSHSGTSGLLRKHSPNYVWQLPAIHSAAPMLRTAESPCIKTEDLPKAYGLRSNFLPSGNGTDIPAVLCCGRLVQGLHAGKCLTLHIDARHSSEACDRRFHNGSRLS